MATLTRGGLSKRTGCNIETIRYYEKIGLMPDPPRSSGGHRLYDDNHLRRLSFIRRARELGFGVEDLREPSGAGRWRRVFLRGDPDSDA